MNKEDIIKIKTLKDNGLSCSQIHEQMYEYSFYQIKHIFSKLIHDTEENINKIKSLSKNYSASEIDEQLNLPRQVTKTLCELHDITLVKTKTFSYSQNEIELMTKYYPKYGRKYMANLLGTTEMKIRVMASKLGLKRNYQYSEQEEQEIISDYKNGLKPYELADKHNRSIHAIESFLSRRGLNNIHNVNSPYYISQPEKYMIDYITKALNIKVPDKENPDNRSYYYKVVDNYEIDLPLYINGYKFAIEYDGDYWHKDFIHDELKNTALQKAGYIVFRVTSKDHNNNFYNLSSLNKKLDEVINAIKLITGSL